MELEALLDGRWKDDRPNYTHLDVNKWRARWQCVLLAAANLPPTTST